MHMPPGRPIDAPGPDHPAADGPGEAVAVPADTGDDAAAPTDGPAPDGAAFDSDRRDPYQPL
ncbi:MULTISPECIES: hypothetical protein [unclassified Solwaraspora]|uniref:hypothetical protein n=1 Tax=unclassified Solwaraspora TaxID=2627926 RepID=UPI00259BA5A8|nr:hypothetical protein [Solwaraspora sp. WMMA2056]WJK39482.1 hypothetical protein O7608_23930 [Solwaraspora sp. WMMA2056]